MLNLSPSAAHAQMLDSLGSTLTKETVNGYFTQQNLDPESDELTIEQVIQALEGEVKKRREDKNTVSSEENDMSSDSATPTPPADLPNLELLDSNSKPDPAVALSVDGPGARPEQDPEVDALNKPAVITNRLPKNEFHLTDEAGIPYDDDDDDDDQEISEESEHLERVINVKECPLCHRPRLNKRTEVDIVTHIAVCASADWGSVNRILVGNYVTACVSSFVHSDLVVAPTDQPRLVLTARKPSARRSPRFSPRFPVSSSP